MYVRTYACEGERESEGRKVTEICATQSTIDERVGEMGAVVPYRKNRIKRHRRAAL